MVSERRTKIPEKKRETILGVAKITSKGQVTLPKKVREHFGFRAGDEIAFVRDEDGTRIIRHFRENPFEKWHGFLKDLQGVDVDAMIDEMRGR